MITVIFVNSIILSLEGNFFTPETYSKLDLGNTFFNAVYLLEFLLKIIGLGVIGYFSDFNNYLDLLIVAFSALDFALLSQPNSIGKIT